MKSKMSFKISLFIESLATVFKWTDEVSIAIVLLQVDFKSLLTTVRFVATLDRADEILLGLMRFSMVS